ncbi:MAG: flagellar biosynthesis anti-sigma factor FlgM [Pseudomonadales bacterium]|nr:flagellar biosynthesis anti-sigma factor FlgM [Pseudomonadales bacterium]
MAIEFNKPSTKNSTGIGTQQSTNTQTSKSTPHSSDAPEKTTGGSDQVAISSHAQRIQALEVRVQQFPEVDVARVEAIKQSIAEGSYKVDAESTAKKMLALEQSIHQLSNKG